MGLRILRCNHCGNIVIFMEDSSVTPICCGEAMEVLVPGSVDGSIEKHVPVIITENEKKPEDKCSGTRSSKLGTCSSYATVRVGASAHPMADDHYIQWILLETNLGVYARYLEPGDAPEACFCLTKGEKAQHAYAYCNIHGLWVDK